MITDKKFDVRDIVHFLPCTLVLIGFGPYYILPSDLKVEILYANRLSEFTLIPKWYFYWGLSIILMAYAIGTYLKFKKFFSKDKELNLWLKLISVLNFLFSISWASYFVLVKTNVLKIEYDYFLTVMMIIFIGMTTYFGFNYQVIFNGKSLKKVFPLIKYEKSGLSEKVSLDLKEKLIHLIKIEALYLNSELKLIDVANLLNISRHHASQLINEYFEMSFYELLNKYRIEEAERLLIDQNSTGLNITDIAFKSGFNNRMSFYNSFKKHFGTTPSEFRNQNLAS
nr:helix-turn-helix domain-containing protein [uncultured Allomuricauda sp.]